MMNKIRKCLKRIFFISKFKLLFKNRISFGKESNFSKTMKISLDKKSKLFIGDYFSARHNMTIQISDENKNSNGAIVSIGNNCFFNNSCSITSLCSIRIGNDCIFGENVHIYDHNHNFKDSSELIRKQGFSSAPVIIGNNCWIGTNVVILKGVTIGNNCVIGAGCVVYKTIPDNSLLLCNGEIRKK